MDRGIVREALEIATGQYIHEVNRLRHLYEEADCRHDVAATVLYEDALRKLVTIIKRRAFTAPTCKHENMQREMAAGWSWMFCDACGHIEGEKKNA